MNRRKKRNVRSSRKSQRSPSKNPKLTLPKTMEEYFSLPTKFRERYDEAINVISEVRSGRRSLTGASREFGISPRLAKQIGRSALRKSANGKYVARKNDGLLRVLVILTINGLQSIGVNDFRQASLVGNYWAAVQRYLLIGDASRLEPFEGKKITDLEGQEYALLTDREELRRFGYAGAVSFESIYARSA